MTDADPRVEAFFVSARTWRAELEALRAILLACPVTEVFKWRSPCYTVQDRNVATVWGLKEACALSFFKGVLLKDPKGILVAPGENSRSVRMRLGHERRGNWRDGRGPEGECPRGHRHGKGPG